MFDRYYIVMFVATHLKCSTPHQIVLPVAKGKINRVSLIQLATTMMIILLIGHDTVKYINTYLCVQM